MNREDQEPRVVHSWTEKDYWKIQARVVLAFIMGGLALISIGTARCVDNPFSRSPFTFLSGMIPIVGGIVFLTLGCLAVRREDR